MAGADRVPQTRRRLADETMAIVSCQQTSLAVEYDFAIASVKLSMSEIRLRLHRSDIFTGHNAAAMGRPHDPRIESAERVGVFRPASRNPNKYPRFQNNSHEASNLAFANSFVRFRPFASIFVLPAQ